MGTEFSQFVNGLVDSVQPNYDGGMVEYMAERNFTQIDQVNFWVSWVGQVMNKGSYTGLIVLGIIWALCLPLICLICWFCLYRRGGCCTTAKPQKPTSFWGPNLDRVLARFPRLSRCWNPSRSLVIGRRSRSVYYVQLLSILLILALFFICLCLVFASNAPLQEKIVSERSPSSLSSSVDSILDDVQTFISSGMNEGRALVHNITARLFDDIVLELKSAIKAFTDDLLVQLQVSDLFTHASRLINSLDRILLAMTRIRSSQTSLFAELHNFMGTVDYAREEIHSRLPRVCRYFTDTQVFSQCQLLQRTADQLTLYINQSKLNFDSSSSLLFIVQQYKLNVTNLASEVNKGKSSIDDMLKTIYSLVKEQVNLKTVTNELDKVWTELNRTVQRVLSTMSGIRRSKTVESYTEKFSGVRIGIFIVPAALLFVFLIILGFLIHESIAFLCGKAGGDGCVSPSSSEVYIMDSVFTTTPTTSTITRESSCLSSPASKKKRTRPSSVSSSFTRSLSIFQASPVKKKAFHWSTLFICMIIMVPAVGLAVCFFVGSALQTELCRYVNTERGRRDSDTIIDHYIQSRWESWIGDLTGGMEPQLRAVFNIPPPSHILRALSRNCSDPSLGIFAAVNMFNLVNASAVVQLPLVKNIVEKGRQLAKEKIGGLNASSMLPTNIRPILNQAKDLTQLFVDNIDYQRSIVELQKTVMRIPDPIDYFHRFNRTMAAAARLRPSDRDVIVLQAICERLMTTIPVYRQLTGMIDQLKANFQVLQDTRTTTEMLVNLTRLFDTVRTDLSNSSNIISAIDPIFNAIIGRTLVKFADILTDYLVYAEARLLKCRDIYLAYSTFEKNVCTNFTTEFNTFTVVFAVALLLFETSMVVLFFHLRKIETLKQTNDSEC